jgi:hypothetical protein
MAAFLFLGRDWKQLLTHASGITLFVRPNNQNAGDFYKLNSATTGVWSLGRGSKRGALSI